MNSTWLTTLTATAIALAAFPAAHGAEGDGPTALASPLCGAPVDILFLFDTTGSMGSAINNAKAGASQIMANVLASVTTAQFAVADYKDYPAYYNYGGYASSYGGGGDYPWQLRQPLTTDTPSVQGAINGLSASGGADYPESLARAVYESRFIGWRAGAVKLVVLFADAPAHDLNFGAANFGQDPGRDGVIGNADDLEFESTVLGTAGAGVKYITINYGGGIATTTMQHIATKTSGLYATPSGSFVTQVTNLILALAPPASLAADAAALNGVLTAPAPSQAHVSVVSVNRPGTDADLVANGLLPTPLNGVWEVAEQHATGALQTGLVTAAAGSKIAEISLLSGLVYARALDAQVSVKVASTATATTSGSTFEYVRVNGVVLPQPIAPNTAIAIPGVGTVVLNEVLTRTDGVSYAEAEVNMIHVYLTGPAQGEAVVGHAYAGATCGPRLAGFGAPA